MWSLGLLACSWLFLQTIGSAHFSRGMSSDRPMEMSANFPTYKDIRIRLNSSVPSRKEANTHWEMQESSNNNLLYPYTHDLRAHEKNIVTGTLVIVRSMPKTGKGNRAEILRKPWSEGADDACGEILNPGQRPWIALVSDAGPCRRSEKIANLLQKSNASGVIFYGDQGKEYMDGSRTPSSVNVGAATGYVPGKTGKRGTRSRQLAVWVKYDIFKNVLVYCNVSFPCNATVSVTIHPNDGLINRTSVLFVSISFILLMIISLAWLVFYYVQRFRYIHAKERLSRRLANAAKKALTKIPVKTLLRGDQETECEYDQCAVCIEQYKPSDTIRILPCRHYFHKSCIDPWLLEQRSCPMCKLDILKAYGLQVRGFSEAPSDTLAEHSELNGLGGRTTSVSLDGTGRDGAVGGVGDEATEVGLSSGEAVGATVRLVSEEGRSCSSSGGSGSCGGGASPGTSSGTTGGGGGIRVTIEPPEVQYHHPQRVVPAATVCPSNGLEQSGGSTVEVRVEQHVPRTARVAADDDEEDDEEDEEVAVARPLVGLSGNSGDKAETGAQSLPLSADGRSGEAGPDC